MAVVLQTDQTFHAPPANIDLMVGPRRVFYRSNMEFVTGILDTTHGGTNNAVYKDDTVIIYSDGKLISTDITSKELSVLRGMGTSDGSGVTMTELLNDKISGIKTYDNVLLDKDNVDHTVKLPDFLLKTGGTVKGNVNIVGKLTIGEHAEIEYDALTKSIVFNVV